MASFSVTTLESKTILNCPQLLFDNMDTKKNPVCPVEEDSKMSKEESTKPVDDQSELVVEDCKPLTPFELSATKGSTDDAKFAKVINSDNQDIPRSNRPMNWRNQGFKGYKPSVGIRGLLRGLLMLVTIPGVLGKCIGDGDVCLILAQKGPDWFDQHPDCLDVKCLDLSKGQHDLLRYFPNVEELYMDDMGNITIPCDVLNSLSNLHKIDLHVKNISPTDVCNTSCVLPEVTVAVFHNTSTIPCDLTERMPKLKKIRFENDQAPTSVSTGIILECVTTTTGNMVNQEKDAGNVVGVVIGVVAFGVVAFGVGFVVGYLLLRNKRYKILCKKSSTPVQNDDPMTGSDQCESES